uniref:DUF2061 domain-containing protein n=1 Tax=Strongyloides venezuelensis TaxID=75913 RepID=A0A0K0FME1_STRVS
MGTFTLSYAVKKIIVDQKSSWLAAGVVMYLGKCWENAGTHKTEMMKGHSRMFADRAATIPRHIDPWRY